MKRLYMLLFIVLIFIEGCFTNTHQNYHGLYIASTDTYKLNMTKSTRVGGLIVKDVYCFGYPVNSAWYDLVAVDDAGNAIESNTVQWSLDDPSMGTLEPAFMTPYARTFKPAEGSAGRETIVRATDGVYTDEAKIVVFPCKEISKYFSFDKGGEVYTQEEADLMLIEGNSDIKIYFLNQWGKIDNKPTLDRLYELTGQEVDLQQPSSEPFWPILFLSKSKSGALYGAQLNGTALAWKLITPAPSP